MPSLEGRRKLLSSLSKSQGGKIPDMRKLSTPMQAQQRMSRLEAVVAMRLHAGILAATVGVPPFMVSYDPKVTAFGKLLEFGGPIPNFSDMNPQRLYDQFMVFYKERERNLKIVERRRAELRQAAEINVQFLTDILPVKQRIKR